MPSLEPNQLIDLFNDLENAKTVKEKSDLLSKAKYYLLNQMSNEQIKAFFVSNASNFENLYKLNIWTKNLEESNGIVDFLEPYDILEKILGSCDSLIEFVNVFNEQTVFLITQDTDEKSKHILVKHLSNLVQNLDLTNVDNLQLVKQDLDQKLKSLLPYFVHQIPKTSVSYTQLLGKLICALTIKMNKLESILQEHLQRVHVFSCSIFDDNQELIKSLETVSKLNSVQSLRIFELIIALGCISHEHLLNICENKFNLGQRINSYLKDQIDVLSKLNCIELMSNLVRSTHGYEYIEKTGHLNYLINFLYNPDSDPFSSLLIPSIVKFFACITKERPDKVKENFPKYLEYLFETSSDENIVKNMEIINLSIETFCFLFENNLVKKYLVENFETNFMRLLTRLVWLIKNSINDKLKSNSIRCFCELISPDPSLLQTDQTDLKWQESPWNASDWINLSKSIYEKAVSVLPHENLFNLFLNLAKEPFADKRHAGQLYFKAMAQTEWGILLLFTPNKFNCEEMFLDGYLLNRSIELEKEGTECKFELNKLLVANMESKKEMINIIGEFAFEKLKQYVREGAFFARGQAQVAFENL